MSRINRLFINGDRSLHSNDWSVSWYALLLTVLLSVALVGLNHDFDVVGGRFEQTVTSGGGLDQQAQFEKSVGGASKRRLLGFAALVAVGALALIGPAAGIRLQFNAVTMLAAAALCWVLASWIWSASRHETARELIRFVAFAFTATALVRRFRVHELLFMLLAVSVASIVIDCAADVAAGTFRPWTREFRLGGSLHPNHMGRLGAILAMIGYCALAEPRLRRLSWALVGFGAVVVIMSGSRSGLVCLVAGLAAIHFVGLAGRRFALGTAAFVAVIGVAMLVIAVAPPSLHRKATRALLMGRMDDAASFTGRVPLWQEMWQDAAKRRWQGYGYGAYWTVERNEQLYNSIHWYPTHSHSAYMELFVDLGFVGLLLVLALAVTVFAHYSRLAAATNRIEYRFLGALMIAGLANGFFEVGFIAPRFEGLFVAMAVLVLVLRAPEEANAYVGRRVSPSVEVVSRGLALRARRRPRPI